MVKISKKTRHFLINLNFQTHSQPSTNHFLFKKYGPGLNQNFPKAFSSVLRPSSAHTHIVLPFLGGCFGQKSFFPTLKKNQFNLQQFFFTKQGGWRKIDFSGVSKKFTFYLQKQPDYVNMFPPYGLFLGAKSILVKVWFSPKKSP